MNQKLSASVFVAASFLGLSAAAHANLLINGSFEDLASFVGNGDNTMSLLAPSPAMTGWTVTGDALAWIGPANPFGLSASAGSYFLDLTDYPVACPCGGVTQTIATTSGKLYRLTFDLGSDSRYGLSDSIEASAGATSATYTSTLLGTNNWETQTLNFVATGPTTVITLQGTVSGPPAAAYIGLDNVSVDEVPEPATLLLFGSGLVSLAAYRRRRKAKA